MRCAVVNSEDGRIVNIILANATTDAPPHDGVFLTNVDDAPQIGWTLVDGVFVGPPPAPDIPIPVTVPSPITRRQCALQLNAMQVITLQEALDMTKTAAVPAAIAAIFADLPTEEQRLRAEIDFAAANYYRNNDLLPLMGLTPEEIDQFFIAAAQL